MSGYGAGGSAEYARFTSRTVAMSEAAMVKPLIVCVGAKGTEFPECVLSELLGGPEGSGKPAAKDSSEERRGSLRLWPLELRTKYYTAETSVAVVEAGGGSSAAVGAGEGLEALVVHWAGEEGMGELGEGLGEWAGLARETELPIRVLLLGSAEGWEAAERWCAAAGGWELVHLRPSPDAVAEALEQGEVVGVARLRQVLQSHAWPNLQLSQPPDHSARLRSRLAAAEEAQGPPPKGLPEEAAADGKGTGGAEQSTSGGEPGREEKMEGLFRAVAGGGDGEVSFEELFANLASLKAQGEGLSGQARRQHAENVTRAFWNAVGGDDDELSDLDDL